MKFLQSLILIGCVSVALFLTSMLLDIGFVQRELVRSIVVYLMMAVEIYLGVKLYVALNKAHSLPE